IYEKSLIPLKRAIDQPNDTRFAVYRITVKGDPDPASAFVLDGRQESRNVKGSTFDLHVRAKRLPPADGNGEKANAQFVQTCPWIDSDDAKIQTYARQAVGRTTDPWRKAQLIEQWVHKQMQVRFDEPFAPASEAAKRLRGDCRQYCLLTTAMCRAAGVPARTA